VLTAPSEHLELLKNAVRQSVAALTVVEVDTVARANELVDLLKFELDKRPIALLSLTAVPGEATRLVDESRKITGAWHSGAGVLFFVDDGQKKGEGAPRFWADMNAQRESWDALKCHIIFFLLPSNYRLLLQVAEHLADWMPLKLHITDPADAYGYEDKDRASYQSAVLSNSELTPKIARQQLAILEQQLTVALHEGIPRKTLARRYYLPMFEAAMSLSDLHRAQSLRQKVQEKDLQAGDIIKWWRMNFWLDYLLYRMTSAESWADKLNKWANKTGDESLKANALHNLGMIAEERRDFEEAEDWYKKSLKIDERLGNEHGVAITYHQLGMIAQERRDFEEAEDWYKKSLKIKERLGDELGAAITYHQFGMIAEERSDFEEAEDWYKKSLKISERLGDELGAASTYGQWGLLAWLQGRVEDSGRWFVKSIAAFSKTRDPDRANQGINNFLIAYQQASQSEQRKLKQCWENAGLGQLPDAAARE
ncbi:MAG: tetratricopeptide repeat protein, partial [Desulfobacterales bacterium]|nr:tetratricopeptide repeat protein [Desulfobacterales bacterium]